MHRQHEKPNQTTAGKNNIQHPDEKPKAALL
jgi:hypothetical protein